MSLQPHPALRVFESGLASLGVIWYATFIGVLRNGVPVTKRSLKEMTLNFTGLSLNILGTALVWKFGIPATVKSDGSFRITKVLGGEPTPEMKKTDRQVTIYRGLSNLGMLLLLVGFILQAVAL